MYVRATFVSPGERETLVVPRSAVLDTGTRKLVYVAKADGVFEAREIQAGTPSEEVYPVIADLKAGEQVVTEWQLPHRFTNAADRRDDGLIRRVEGIQRARSRRPAATPAPTQKIRAVHRKDQLAPSSPIRRKAQPTTCSTSACSMRTAKPFPMPK